MAIINTLSGLQNVANSSYTYGTSAYDFVTNTPKEFSLLEGGKSINVTGGTPYGKIINIAPKLEGGVATGVSAPYISEAESAALSLTGAGAYVELPLIDVLGGLFAGFGLSVVAYEANKDFWIDVSNNTFGIFPGYEPIRPEHIEDYSLLTLFQNDTTYISAECAKQFVTYLLDIGAFDIHSQFEIEGAIPIGEFTPQLHEIGLSYISGVVRNFYLNNASTDTYPMQPSLMFIVNHMQEHIPANSLVYMQMYYSFSGGVPIVTTLSVRYCDFAETDTITVTNSAYDSDNNLYYRYNTDKVGNGFEYMVDVDGTFTVRATEDVSMDGFIGQNRQLSSTGYYTLQISNINSVLTEVKPAYVQTQTGKTPETPNIPLEFPDWWANIFELPMLNPEYVQNPQPEPQPEPAVNPLIISPMLPITLPSINPVISPIIMPQIDAQLGNLPAIRLEPIINATFPFFGSVNPIIDIGDINIPTGNTPIITPIPPIGGSANALFTVYKPTQEQLNRLGGVLWSENIIQQIVQLFQNNPMDAIISLHILYATPSTGGSQNIKLGYVDSGVSSLVVNNQYINIDCGTVRVPEYFGDARDYSPFTTVHVFLPFIGIRELKTEDIIASTININYKVDVFTGTTLCNITVNKSGTSQVLYTFEGNCSVSLPLTGADKSRQLASVGSIIMGGVLGGVGGAVMAGTHAISSGGAKATIQRSGNFSGNAGAMGGKKPYIIINRSIPYDAESYNNLYGYPTNKTVRLSDCSGYTRVKDVHVDDVSNATKEEKLEIENLLKNGVIVN